MKKRNRTILLIFFSFSFLLIFIINISNPFFKGKIGYSGSIKKSKELGVFVSEYKLPNGYIDFGNNNKFLPGEIWVEKIWSEGDFFSPTKILNKNGSNKYWLFIEIPEKTNPKMDSLLNSSKNRISFLWENKSYLGIRSGGNKKFFQFTFDLLPPESLTIKIINPNFSIKNDNSLSKVNYDIIISEFELKKM